MFICSDYAERTESVSEITWFDAKLLPTLCLLHSEFHSICGQSLFDEKQTERLAELKSLHQYWIVIFTVNCVLNTSSINNVYTAMAFDTIGLSFSYYDINHCVWINGSVHSDGALSGVQIKWRPFNDVMLSKFFLRFSTRYDLCYQFRHCYGKYWCFCLKIAHECGAVAAKQSQWNYR